MWRKPRDLAIHWFRCNEVTWLTKIGPYWQGRQKSDQGEPAVNPLLMLFGLDIVRHLGLSRRDGLMRRYRFEPAYWLLVIL